MVGSRCRRRRVLRISGKIESMTDKQKETVRGAAMLIAAQMAKHMMTDEHIARKAVSLAKKLVEELEKQGL